MYKASLGLVGVAGVALVYGWVESSNPATYVCIAAAILAGLLLILSTVMDRFGFGGGRPAASGSGADAVGGATWTPAPGGSSPRRNAPADAPSHVRPTYDPPALPSYPQSSPAASPMQFQSSPDATMALPAQPDYDPMPYEPGPYEPAPYEPRSYEPGPYEPHAAELAAESPPRESPEVMLARVMAATEQLLSEPAPPGGAGGVGEVDDGDGDEPEPRPSPAASFAPRPPVADYDLREAPRAIRGSETDEWLAAAMQRREERAAQRMVRTSRAEGSVDEGTQAGADAEALVDAALGDPEVVPWSQRRRRATAPQASSAPAGDFELRSPEPYEPLPIEPERQPMEEPEPEPEAEATPGPAVPRRTRRIHPVPEPEDEPEPAIAPWPDRRSRRGVTPVEVEEDFEEGEFAEEDFDIVEEPPPPPRRASRAAPASRAASGRTPQAKPATRPAARAGAAPKAKAAPSAKTAAKAKAAPRAAAPAAPAARGTAKAKATPAKQAAPRAATPKAASPKAAPKTPSARTPAPAPERPTPRRPAAAPAAEPAAATPAQRRAAMREAIKLAGTEDYVAPPRRRWPSSFGND